jgi:hypothetical protein
VVENLLVSVEAAALVLQLFQNSAAEVEHQHLAVKLYRHQHLAEKQPHHQQQNQQLLPHLQLVNIFI